MNAEARLLRVSVACSASPGEVKERLLELPPGSTALQALQASGLIQDLPELQGRTLDVGVWGRACPPSQVLEDGDRLEIYRPLRVDPKVARRERFKGQGMRTAGLFKDRRPDAKAGY